MPQHTAFPRLPPRAPTVAVDGLIAACAAMPEGGEDFRELRTRLKRDELYKSDDAAGLLAFLHLPSKGQVTPSPVILALQGAEDAAAARRVMAERLWTCNPVLFKSVFELLDERPYTRDEIVAFVQSQAYRGEPVPRAQLLNWITLAIGLELLVVVGIAVKQGPASGDFAVRAKDLDIGEFLEDDAPERPPVVALGDKAAAADEPDADPGTAPSRAAAPVAMAPQARAMALVPYPSPLGRNRPVPRETFADSGRFDDAVLAESRARIDAWWSEQTVSSKALAASDFGLDAELWMEGADEALYRLAVAAALAFRLERSRDAIVLAFRRLTDSGVMGDLYFGTAPHSLPSDVDSQALMLASLVARRCAEAPELAANLEKQKSARDAFGELESALGRGLFNLELFWMMRALGEMGVLRHADLGEVATVPTRLVRDTLFRLGAVQSPYAPHAEQLLGAAGAAHRLASDPDPGAALEAFALAAGCAYDCPNRRRCEYACRERADL